MIPRYKVELKFTDGATLNEVFEFSEGQNSQFANEQDLRVRFARSQKYKGIFQEVTPEFGFVKNAKAWIDEKYYEFLSTYLNDSVVIEITILRPVTTGAQNQFVTAFFGVVDWASFDIREARTNVSFLEDSNQANLLNKQNIEYNIDGLQGSKNYLYNANLLLETDSAGNYGGEISYTVKDPGDGKEIQFPPATEVNLPLVLNNSLELQDIPIGEYYKDNINIDVVPVNASPPSQYRLAFNFISPDPQVPSSPFFRFTITPTSGGTHTLRIVGETTYKDDLPTKVVRTELFLGTGSIDPNDITKVIVPLPTNTVFDDFDVDRLAAGASYRVLWYWDNDLNPSATQSALLFSQIEVEHILPSTEFEIKTGFVEDVFRILRNRSGLVFDETDIYLDRAMRNLYFTSGKGLEGQEISFQITFGQLFDDISAMAAYGLQLNNSTNVLEFKRLDDIYNLSGSIIELGEVKRLRIGFADIQRIKKISCGGLENSFDWLRGDFEYNVRRIYERNFSDETELLISPTAGRIDESFFNKTMLDRYKSDVSPADKEEDQELFYLVSDVNSTDILPLFTPLTPWESRFGLAINLELCGNESFRKWINYMGSLFAFNSLGDPINSLISRTAGKKSLGQRYFDGSLNFNCSPDAYNGNENGFEIDKSKVYFGKLNFEIETELNPEMIDTIKQNKSSQYSFTFEGKRYYGWLNDLEVNPISDTNQTISLTQSSNGI